MSKGGKILGSDILRLLGMILRMYRWRLAAVLVMIVISSLCTLAMTLFTKVLFDDYILVMLEKGSQDFSPLARALTVLSGILVLGAVLGYAWNAVMVCIGQDVMKSIRVRLFDHLQELEIRYFDSRSHGDIMSIFTNDVETLRHIISRTIPMAFSALITVISALVSMVILSMTLTWVTILTTALLMYVSLKMGRRSKRYFKERQENLADVNGYVEELVSGQRTVKVLSHEKEVLDQFDILNERLRRCDYGANRVANIVMPVNVNMTNLGYVLIAILGGLLSISLGAEFLSLGALVSYLTLHKNFSRPFSVISQEVNSIAMASAGAGRIFSLEDEPCETDQGKVLLVHAVMDEKGNLTQSPGKTGNWAWKKGETFRELRGEVRFEHVTFSYLEGKEVLSDLSLTAYPGQKIALVGSTGAGKTTITNLISRFYDIQRGRITYDGLNIQDIRKESLRKSLGFVLQDTCLFSGTILENIRYGRLDATDQECRDAARLALADGFIRRLPQGYSTPISGDGENLSQGERQLLSIARTAVSDPPVLILDEATSSIDSRSERLVQEGMDRIMQDRTTFVIAHRLSTIMNADYIIVLEAGRIIEAGKHQELLERRGRYYELFKGGEMIL